MLAALDAAQQRGTPYDLSSVQQIMSSGVMWSQETKQGFSNTAPVRLVNEALQGLDGIVHALVNHDLDAAFGNFQRRRHGPFHHHAGHGISNGQV